MHRRRVLATVAGGVAALAGCSAPLAVDESPTEARDGDPRRTPSSPLFASLRVEAAAERVGTTLRVETDRGMRLFDREVDVAPGEAFVRHDYLPVPEGGAETFRVAAGLDRGETPTASAPTVTVTAGEDQQVVVVTLSTPEAASVRVESL
jgi:hypothetical protein